MGQSKKDRKESAAAVGDAGTFEITDFGRRRKRSRALVLMAWVGVTLLIPFSFVVKHLRRPRDGAA